MTDVLLGRTQSILQIGVVPLQLSADLLKSGSAARVLLLLLGRRDGLGEARSKVDDLLLQRQQSALDRFVFAFLARGQLLVCQLEDVEGATGILGGDDVRSQSPDEVGEARGDQGVGLGFLLE